jgi:hypothetical protein
MSLLSSERKFCDAQPPDFLVPYPVEASQTMSKLPLALCRLKFVSAMELQ